MHRRYRLVVPVRVDAVQVTSDTYSWAATWCRGVENVRPSKEGDKFQYAISVPTLHGVKTASMGDYVVKNASGDFAILDQQAFEIKYRLERPEEAQ